MSVQNTMHRIKLQGWAQMIQDCQQSGLSIREWCKENGVSTKTYYYRRKRVREELLDTMEVGKELQLAPMRPEGPVFATFPMPQGKGAAVSVCLGGYTVDIQNGADCAIVEQVLKVVSRL